MTFPTKRTPIQRKLVYRLLRNRNVNNQWARRLRDWTQSKINVYLRNMNKEEIKIPIEPLY